jgi:hypothetical protein
MLFVFGIISVSLILEKFKVGLYSGKSIKLMPSYVPLSPLDFSFFHIGHKSKADKTNVFSAFLFSVYASFSTKFLIFGGRIEHLQKILGHSKITDTKVCFHIVDQITDVQICNMDGILN